MSNDYEQATAAPGEVRNVPIKRARVSVEGPLDEMLGSTNEELGALVRAAFEAVAGTDA